MMALALEEAALALAEREVPVGCVFAAAAAGGGAWRVQARAHNRTNANYSPLQHAEMVALDALVAALPPDAAGAPPLPRLRAALAASTLFVTVEPCIMCADALARAGVRRVVFGCPNDKFGGCGTVVDVFGGATEADWAAGGARVDVFGSAAEADGAAGGARAPPPPPRVAIGGVRAGEAVALLKRFYARANERAEAAAAAAAAAAAGRSGEEATVD